VHLVASSFGCAIALNLLDVASDLVETAIVSGGTAGLGRILGAISLAGTGIYRIIPMETLIKLSYQQFSIPAQYQPMFHDDIARVLNADFTRKITTAMMHVQLPAHTRVPVLAAVGQRETWPAKQAARKIARLLPHGQGVLVPRVGHIWNLQAPDLFTAMIRAWVTHAPLPAELRPL
jgi:pimeloyl-ACP methyl ester carboxylesterase